MTARIYARVSTDEPTWQDPDRQLGPLRAFCKDKGLGQPVEYVDRVSGADIHRPDFRRMIKESVKGDIIYCLEIDRFARFKPWDTMSLLWNLKANGIFVKSITESFADTSSENTQDWFLLDFTLWFAFFEREHIKGRVKSGIASKRFKGEWHGGRPKGKADASPRSRRWFKKPVLGVETLYKNQ